MTRKHIHNNEYAKECNFNSNRYSSYSKSSIANVNTKPEAQNSPSESVHVSPNGSLRYNKGKPEMSHLNPQFLLDMANLMTASANKYGKFNYAKGQYYSTAYDSLQRHALQFMSGEDNDKESGYSHLTHIALNAMIMWCTQQYYPELDDRMGEVLGIDITKKG